MKYINKIASVMCSAALGLLVLTGCEGGELYNVNDPDWRTAKIDSIKNSNNSSSEEEELVGMKDDVYTIGNTDYTSGWWSSFSKYYVIEDGVKWNAVFKLNINPDDNTYYKNFALVITNDVDRGGDGYTEYGAFRYDATTDTATYNSQWGTYLYFRFTESNLYFSPTDNLDEGLQKLGGKVILTVDRSVADTFRIKITNGTVTKTYTQPYELPNLNADASNTNIRCFLVPEGSYINFLQSNVEPIGGYTSAEDKAPVSMVLQNVPDEVDLGTDLEEAMADVTALVTYEEGVTATVTASDLHFTSIPDMDTEGEKTLVAVYNKTVNGNIAENPIVANATFNVVTSISSIEITQAPTHTTYYYYVTDATAGLDRTLAFDPTDMIVTATYATGATGTVSNDKLTFSSIPAEEGTHTVTISTKNGKTTTTKVKVETTGVTYVTMTPTILGAEDNTSGFWSVLADDVKIPAGKTYAVNLTNYTSGANNFNNFVVILRNSDLTKEYAVVRADNYGWSVYTDNYATSVITSGGQTDWAAWLAAMNGADVTVYVTNCNNSTAEIQMIMNGNDGNTYTQYYLNIPDIDSDDLGMTFTIDGSHIVFK